MAETDDFLSELYSVVSKRKCSLQEAYENSPLEKAPGKSPPENASEKSPPGKASENSPSGKASENSQPEEASENRKPPPPGVQGEKRIVLVGRTGEGKSATANTIFGKKVFVSKCKSGSVTADCDYHTEEIKGRLLCVIDTPGLFDTTKTNDDIKQAILKYLGLTSPGPHVFLVVIKIGRFTEELENTYKTVCEMFGNEIHRFSIVVLTGGDELEYNDQTVEEYLKEAPKNFREVLKNASNRFVVFNNRAKGQEKERQVNDLLETVDSLIKTNQNCFSSETYISVENVLQELENRDEIIKNKEKEAKILKDELMSQKAEIQKRKKDQDHRESQYMTLEREYEAKLRNLEYKYEKQLTEARRQTRADIQTKKIDPSESWFKGRIKGARHKLKSVLNLH